MAEAIASLAIERILDLLIHEAVFLSGVNEEVEGLKAQLKRMRCFLEDADRKQEQDERFRNRVSDIRELAYDAEDAIESFILKLANHEGLQGTIKRITSIFTKPFHLHKIAVQVKAIQTQLGDISGSLPAYAIPGEGEGSSSNSRMQQLQRLRRTYSHVEEEDVVSLEVSMKDVLAQLMKEEDRLHAVVSIVGMGGIGKTTLARKVYNHSDVKHNFDCLAWVCISQRCKPREVMHDVLIKLLSPSKADRELINKLKEEELVRRIFDFLKEKRYLVVLDDIWKGEDWDSLKPAFPQGKKGSKLLFTTRNRDVALRADPCNSPIELPLLTDDESWRLFIRKAFPRKKTESHACSENFERLGRQMVKKCGGLPLAIVVLGGLLATKRSWPQWETVHRNIHGHLKGFQQKDHQYADVNGVFLLSYNDLPCCLKPCFLYLGHYPEDWEISKKELIRLWIAEGFISPSSESETMEDVAEEFLEELANRCLVQVGKRDYTGIGVKTCRIHDLLRDLCVEKAREQNFLGIMRPTIDENNDSSPSVTLTASMPRRIAVHPDRRYFRLKGEHPKLRSLLLFQIEGFIELHISKSKNFKFLRVLNLVEMNVDKWHVSSQIGNLRHLRHLRLDGPAVIILPRSIGKLKNLHTLKVRSGLQSIIPNIVFKLEHLRHVILDNYPLRVEGKGMCLWTSFVSKNIETLKTIVVNDKSIENNALLSLTNIRILGITFERSEYAKRIVEPLIELRRLRSLSIWISMDSSLSYPDLEPLSQCHDLSKLKLSGKIEEDPHSSHHVLKFLPSSIVKLTLSDSKMGQDPMGVLEKLPHLRILNLWSGSYTGSKLICSANGFLQLHSLQIVGLEELEELEIEEGAMLCLRSLRLGLISNLKMFPEGLRYITTLEEMRLDCMKSSFVDRIKVTDGREGEDLYKVRHIPSIQIFIVQED